MKKNEVIGNMEMLIISNECVDLLNEISKDVSKKAKTDDEFEQEMRVVFEQYKDKINAVAEKCKSTPVFSEEKNKMLIKGIKELETSSEDKFAALRNAYGNMRDFIANSKSPAGMAHVLLTFVPVWNHFVQEAYD